ncbi:hypothetical protein [Flavobacterium sp.]|uniref:hypothetical protein n=1 Tax=Flavobacterium sp. TaxID=239 RepID=UPI00286BB476|nr:hypothetical protein [Flavobacterium sp.]
MQTQYIIPKDRKLPLSQDFEFLQQEGLKYVERLGHKFWTDYNPHDPGVTILEILCYAITELGYRSDFDIRDLLADNGNTISNNTFFTAAEIFPNAALTVMDYRKLLIDIKGISNAWLLPTKKTTDADGYWEPNDSEAKIYLNKLEDKISLKNTDRNGKLLEELHVKGLGKIKIELEEDPILGDLNTLLLEFPFWHEDRWINLRITPQFTNWNHPDAGLFKKMNTPSEITIGSIEKTQGIIYLIVNRYGHPGDTLRFRVFCDDPDELDIALVYLNNEGHVCEIISDFEKKKEKIEETFSAVSIALQQNRNLTEDYLCLEVIEKVPVAVCADIEIETGFDPVAVMTQIQIAIDNVINPKINFYTLSQLVNEGLHSEEIFTGPRLQYGFLKEDEVEKAKLPTGIHASDIIAVLMEIPGVKSVKNLLMTAYNFLGQPITGSINESWVLGLSGEVKPIFNIHRSKLLLFQKNIPFLLSETQQMQVDQKVMMYKMQSNQKKLMNSRNDFEIGAGEHYKLQNYYSIQDEFPAAYGLGKNYLSENEKPLRKAQVKQLKGYLYFYEQILADFFNQLYHAKNLFDTHPIDRTYFPAYLEKDPDSGADFYSASLYSADLKNILLDGEFPDDEASLYESNTKFYDRRNRVLDHLMARFSENFNEYVFMMYRLSNETAGMGTLSFDYDDLIADKQNFINDYPKISSNRSLGMDYLNAKITPGNPALQFNAMWNSDNRGGYEKRTAKLLGINNMRLRDIVTEKTTQSQWTVETEDKSYRFKIINPAVDLPQKWDWAQQHFTLQLLYRVEKHSGNYYLYLFRKEEKIARVDEVFPNKDEAFAFLNKMIREVNKYHESFYCLEHILLRPFDNSTFSDDTLLSVCLNDNCDDVANNDPYSFKATLVLPGYLSRFQNLTFRKYAEKIFRQEAPAHVLLKICWVNKNDLLAFQEKYKNWLEKYRVYRLNYCSNTLTDDDKSVYGATLNELVAALKELHTIYPEGNLYDCRLSESNNPIILGNTSLGTL